MRWVEFETPSNFDKLGRVVQDISTKARGRITEHEGMLLAVIRRQQPVARYQLFKTFEQSPVSSINSSKGQLYPAIRRLKARGFINSTIADANSRDLEMLTLTASGEAAVRDWVTNLQLEHITLDDPLRTRVLSFDLLGRDEKIKWIARAKKLVDDKRQEIEKYNQTIDVPFQSFAMLSATQALNSKMNWLDKLLYSIVED